MEQSKPKSGRQPSQWKLHCRVEPLRGDLALYCFERRNGTLTFADGKLRMVWSPTLTQSNVIEAKMTSATHFEGREMAKLMGAPILTWDNLTGDKLTTVSERPDIAGKASLLRTILGDLATAE